MRSGALAVLACAIALQGCAYHNVIRNARGLYLEAEEHRRSGRDSLAELGYGQVVQKAGEAIRARPDSEWAAEALYYLGVAHLGRGELRAARSALDEAAAGVGHDTRSDDLRRRIAVAAANVRAELGDRSGALAEINAVLQVPHPDDAPAGAYLLRGRLLLGHGILDPGWWDLDQASRIDPDLRVEAGIERLRWAVHHGDRPRTHRAADALLRRPDGGARLDTIASLVDLARTAWGPEVAAGLLANVNDAAWSRDARGRMQLRRALLLDEAGDTLAAVAQARVVGEGLGEVAADARLVLFSWRAARARDLVELYRLRSLLLPAESDPEVSRILGALLVLEAYADAGLDDPLGWFAAAEVARDEIGAPVLARGLFLAYADASPDQPWAPKALLAALATSSGEGDRAWLRGRLEAHARSPYVLAAHGGTAAGFQALEEELDVRLEELTRR